MSDIVNQLLLQLVLILLNAFFAATEIAVISLNEKRIKARADDGDKKAVKMLRMIEEPTRFLSTIQIGITLAGFLGSAFAADNFAERLSDFFVETFSIPAAYTGAINTVAVIVITLILSFFTLVLGERDGAAAAHVLAAVRKAAAARLGDDMAADRALVAGDLDNFDDIRIMLVAAHCELDALLHDRALLIDTAAHCRLILDDQLRDLVVCSEEIILKPIPRNLAQYLVFQVLYLGIKFSHA